MAPPRSTRTCRSAATGTGGGEAKAAFDLFVLEEAFALEGFFAALSQLAASFDHDKRAQLEERINSARELLGAQDAIEQFLQWDVPTPGVGESDNADNDSNDDIDQDKD